MTIFLFAARSSALLLAGGVLMSATARADAPVRPTSPEIVVTAPLESARTESLQGAEVLKRTDIVQALNGGLGTTLANVPGIATSFFGAGASRPIIRGLGEDRVLVLQNGVGAIDASTASPDHAVTSDGLDAERIEILRGAAALAYGGNAIGGVVNVIDQSIPMRPIDGVHGHAIASASSVDQGREGALDLASGFGPFALRGSVSARDTEDYDTPIGKVPNSWTRSRTYAGGAALTGGAGFAGLAAKRVENEYGLLPEAPGEAGGHIGMTQTRIESRGEAKVGWGAIDRLDYAVQHSDYAHTEFEADGTAGTRFESKGYEARGEAHHAHDGVFGGALKGAFGAQASDVDFEAIGTESFISPTNTRKGGLFVVERWDAGRWGVEGGARLDRTRIDNRGGGKRTFDGASASLGIFLRPAEGWFTGLTAARAERAPSGVELFAEGLHLATQSYEIGSATLGSETADSIEATLRYGDKTHTAEVNIYRVNFSDYIALVERGDVHWDADGGREGFAASPNDPSIPADARVLPVFAYVQKDATFTGGEVSLSGKLADIGAFTLKGHASLDLVRAEFASGGALPRIPPRTARLGFSLENAKWTISAEGVDAARQTRTATFETQTPGYQMLNAGVAWRPKGEDGTFTIRLDGRNLTDELARVHSSFLKDRAPLPGRSVRLALTADF